ncbi:hypothetical protein [Kitasatospora acidiphila]|nr:hypothetical protein [Kitasatospora acidiphila]
MDSCWSHNRPAYRCRTLPTEQEPRTRCVSEGCANPYVYAATVGTTDSALAESLQLARPTADMVPAADGGAQ